MGLSVLAKAKVNLFLDVLGRRDDGYHDIRTVFLPLTSPADIVSIASILPETLRIVCAHPAVPVDSHNLCWQAAMAFAEAAAIAPAWEISIEKRIPVAAGLGGGSSDAAAVLRGLNRMHGHVMSDQRLLALASVLGADVPFFLESVPAVGAGIGDVLHPVAACDGFDVVLAWPGFPVPASWAYANRLRVPAHAATDLGMLLAGLARGDAEEIARHCGNALEYGVCDKFPLVDMLAGDLMESGCLTAHVSGSGPTVYGICAKGRGASIAQSVATHFGGAIWTCAAQPVTGPGDGPMP